MFVACRAVGYGVHLRDQSLFINRGKKGDTAVAAEDSLPYLPSVQSGSTCNL